MERRVRIARTIAAVFLTSLVLVGAAQAAPQAFNPEGCDFAVTFPDEPRIRYVIVPDFGEIQEAEIDDHRGLMRANCIHAEKILFYEDRQLLLDTLRAFAEQNGLGYVSYFHEEVPLGIRAGARGTKRISGRWTTYETWWYVSRRSVLSLTVGHDSELYPSREISEFLDSVIRGSSESAD